MTDEELVSVLRKRGGNYPSLAADRIEALIAERDARIDPVEVQALVNAAEPAMAEALAATEAERDRLRESLMDAREAWDNHMEYGEPMQGWWVADARAVLEGESYE